MKGFKNFLAVFLVSLTVVTAIPVVDSLTVITVEAHSGKTDANGGHKDKKNVSGLGAYHYHCGGNPAHLHENGVCPYASGSTVANSTKTSAEPATDNSKNNNTNNTSNAGTVKNNAVASQSTQPASKSAKQTVTISDTSYDNVAFNASYYASAYADVYEACGDNAKALYNHYIKNGIKEGRQSSTQFCITVYKNNNQDLVDAFGDDLIKYYNHYIEYGVNENRVSK